MGETKIKCADVDVNLLNRLKKFSVSGVKIRGGMTEFRVPLKHRGAVTRLLGKRDFVIADNRNVWALLNFFYTRLTIVIMAVVCAVAFVVSEQYAFRVKLSGVTGAEYDAVAAYMRENGLDGIVAKRRAMQPETAREIVKAFPFVAHAGLYLHGSTITVVVSRADYVTISGDPIIAPMDGVVVDIIVFAGVAKVFNGSVVRAGDILVDGDRPKAIIKIQNGEETRTVIN